MSDVRGPHIGLPERVHEFVVACTTDDLTDDLRTAFEQLLRESDDACRLYLKCVDISVALPSILSAIPDEESPYDISFLRQPPNTPPSAPAALGGIWHGTAAYFSSGWPMAYLIATVVVSVGLVTAALMHVSRNEGPASAYSSTVGGHPTGRESQAEIVGRITGMIDCQWADPQSEAFDGTNVPLGRKYALSSGLMEITYDTGTKVILQGPVSFEVESINGGFLLVGKLTGKVEVEKAKGFSVRTPTATVTDLGTEFGVEVDRSGNTISHVFQGAVRLESVGNAAGTEFRILAANESAWVARSGSKGIPSVQSIAADPAAFVRSEQLRKMADENRLKSFRRWETYRRDLCKDASLLAYYDFQRQNNSPSMLLNVAGNLNGSLDGMIENAAWKGGQMRGKHSLRFLGVSDSVQVDMPQTVDNLTLAAWIHVLWLGNFHNGLLMSDGWGRQGALHWQVQSDGCVSLDICRKQASYLSSPLFSGKRLCRWTHLAVVYDRADGNVRFYVDGRVTDVRNIDTHVPIRIGKAKIANWDPAGAAVAEKVRNFSGMIAELVVLGRPLASDEIRRMFEAGRAPAVFDATKRAEGK